MYGYALVDWDRTPYFTWHEDEEQTMSDTKTYGIKLSPQENLPSAASGRLEHPGHRIGVDLGGGDAPVYWDYWYKAQAVAVSFAS